MSAEGKKKRGISGVSNAKNIPFRYHGGNYTRPAFMTPETKLARDISAPRDGYFQSATYHKGMFGGVLASRLGYRFGGDEAWDDQLKAAE